MLLPSAPDMRSWRAWGVAAAAAVATILVIVALLEFLAPELSYQLRDRGAEVLSGTAGRKYRIALGATSGSSYRVGTALNRYLQSRAGYELELVPQPRQVMWARCSIPTNPSTWRRSTAPTTTPRNGRHPRTRRARDAILLRHRPQRQPRPRVPRSDGCREHRRARARTPADARRTGTRILRAGAPAVAGGRAKCPCLGGAAHAGRRARGLRQRAHVRGDEDAVPLRGSRRRHTRRRRLSPPADPRSRGAGPIDTRHQSRVHPVGPLRSGAADSRRAGADYRGDPACWLRVRTFQAALSATSSR